MRHRGVLLVLALAITWAVIVMFSGWESGWNPSGVMWDFETTGQLGDSFGVLSATMAGIAAYFAFRTYRSARDDSAMLERRAAEPSYLNLLERRYDVLDRLRTQSIRLGGAEARVVETNGQAVLDRLAVLLRNETDRPHSMADSFKGVTKGVLGLPNLYRFTYHIISFANRQLSQVPDNSPMHKNDPAYQYVRLLRAQMADSELLLVALNCAYGEGREKFKPLVERYALLHNMNPDDIRSFALRDLFEATAFGLLPADQGVTAEYSATETSAS